MTDDLVQAWFLSTSALLWLHTHGKNTWQRTTRKQRRLSRSVVRHIEDLPLWVPPSSGMEGFVRVDINRAVEAGLTFRPMAQTVQDSLAWYRTLDDGSALKAGLTAQREAELLEKWHLSKTN